jgi:hypothetical protein
MKFPSLEIPFLVVWRLRQISYTSVKIVQGYCGVLRYKHKDTVSLSFLIREAVKKIKKKN